MSHLCAHGQNPTACLTCFRAPKAKSPVKTAPQTVSPGLGAKTILDRIKERGTPAPLPPVPSPMVARPAPTNPHENSRVAPSNEPLDTYPTHPSIIDRQPRRHDA